MSKIRNILAGSLASVIGLSMSEFAQGQTPEDTGLTHAEVRKELYDKATRVSYDTW